MTAIIPSTGSCCTGRKPGARPGVALRMSLPYQDPMGPRTLVAQALCACILMLTGCAGLSSETSARVDLAGYTSFDFGGPVEPEPGATLGSADLQARAESELEAALSELGLARSPKAAADLLLAVRFAAEEEIEYRDPYFSVYPAEKYETVSLVLELTAARTGIRVWRGVARVRSRCVARAVGVGEMRFRPVDEERQVPVEDMVRHLTSRLSVRRP
ncbi:MAG: DUF4136 domain-containing protein [Planctomycetota bacterium]|nr:DUF4136 domain-containing protein [Planctomycetota bacterium]MDA0932515.1 DUF4136 domain-containing protein [Planctomycetota bacterium]